MHHQTDTVSFRGILLVTLLTSCISATRTHADPPQYTVVDLTAETGQFGIATDISDSGLIVGERQQVSLNASGFIWQQVEGQWTVSDLPFAQPFCYWIHEVTGVNDQGTVIGSAYCHLTINEAVIWEGDSAGLNFSDGRALDVNSLNQVVGQTSIGFGAVMWEGFDRTILSGGRLARGINELSGIVGESFDNEATLWLPGADPGVYEATPLGTLGGAISFATEINDAGQIVGTSSIEPQGLRAFLWEAGVMSDLGTLDGFQISLGNDINNAGQVVGCVSASGSARAFVWTGGVMYNLNDIIVSGSDITLLQASAINNLGHIAGWGEATEGGSFHAFVALPILPGDLDHNGTVDAADLALLLGAWGVNPGNPADLNSDDTVNAADLLLLLGDWTCP